MIRKVIAGLVAFIILTGLFVLLFTYLVPKDEKNESGSTEDSAETAQKLDDDTETADAPEGYETYVADELNFSFSYPKQWGNVSRNQTTRTNINNDNQVQYLSIAYSVGPLYIISTSSGSDKIGDNEDPAVTYSKGFIRKENSYYPRFAYQQSPDSTEPLNEESFDYFNQLKVDDETVLVFGKNCGDAPDCILGAVMNLSNDNQYPGVGVRYDRTFGQEQGKLQSFNKSVEQLETVLKTVRMAR